MNAPAHILTETGLETLASAHSVELRRHVAYAMKAIRDGDPILAAVELDDARKRIAELDGLILALDRKINGGSVSADLQVHAECGRRFTACTCDVPFG